MNQSFTFFIITHDEFERMPKSLVFCVEQNMIMHIAKPFCIILRRKLLLPNHIRNKIVSPKHLIHDNLEIVCLVVIDGNPYASVFRKQFSQQLQTRIHQRKPLCMLKIIVVVLESASRVIRGIDGDTLYPAGEVGEEGFESF